MSLHRTMFEVAEDAKLEIKLAAKERAHQNNMFLLVFLLLGLLVYFRC